MKKINLYFRKKPEGDRWLPFDRYIIPVLRRLLKGKKVSGIEKVFINLCRGLDELQISYSVNKPFSLLGPDEAVIVLGIGEYSLEGYRQPNKIIAGIGLMTHPAAWPQLCNDFPVVRYLQHSEWTRNIYVPYYSAAVCQQWPAGIDTVHWSPASSGKKDLDILVYNKIMWDKSRNERALKMPILDHLTSLGLSFTEIRYGGYKEKEYHDLLKRSKAMLFLCEHESQGFACCEALSMNVPVLAWDQGWWLDPDRFKWNEYHVPATSIPFFDHHCGRAFSNWEDFNENFAAFWKKVNVNEFQPRNYIIENISLKKSAQKMLDIINDVYS